jgi:predicted TPR repeat methyltransferase
VKGINYAKQFTWSRTSQEIFKFVRECSLRNMTDAIEFHEREAKIFKDKYLDKKSFRFRLRLWGKIIRSLDSPVVRSMDLGCGPGWMTKILCEVSSEVVAIDGSEQMILQSQEILGKDADRVKFLNVPITPQLFDSFSTESFDLIISSSVLEYVERADQILAKTYTLLSRGGKLIFSIPNKASWFRSIEGLVFKWFGKPRYRGTANKRMEPQTNY